MKRAIFRCKFITDVVLNASAATEGNNRTLDYIPGSGFLGMSASAYASFGEEAYHVFHSGKVRFCDGHLVAGERSLKVPAAFYLKKGESLENNSGLWVHHLISGSEKENLRANSIQLKQQRSGYMVPCENGWRLVNGTKDFTIKSAYDRAKRKAEDEKMFGYEYLNAGLEWEFYVDFDGDVEHLLEPVKNSLVGRRRLGRSKTAQFGLVEISHVKDESINTMGVVEVKELVFYAESCLAFVNEFGMPTLTPKAEDFGVEGTILWDKCQLLTRTYAPWNQTRFSRDGERVCIDKGSVIVIEQKGQFDTGKALSGVGLYRNEGFGRVLVNPIFLTSDSQGVSNLRFLKECVTGTGASIQTVIPQSLQNDPLVRFLKQTRDHMNADTEILKAVQRFTDDPANIRLFRKIQPSQWGGIRERARRADNLPQLMKLLFGKEDGKVDPQVGYLTHGVASEDWRERGRLEKLEQWIMDRKELVPQATIVLAAAMAKKFNKKQISER